MYGKKLSRDARDKITKSRVREKNPNWKNGIIRRKDNQCILILTPNHPFANHQGYVYEHRLVMEKKLGRYLRPEEVVHHINEIKNDNRPENLYLFKNASAHRSYHNFVRYTYKKWGIKIKK